VYSKIKFSLHKKIVFVVWAVLLCFYGVWAQGQPDLAGRWEGAIDLPGTALGVGIDFSKNAGGAWQGDIDIPMQGAKDLPLINIKMEGTAISFAIQNVPGNPTFKGTVAADGNSIAGDFTQSGQTFPFTLKRKSAAELEAKSEQQKVVLQQLRAFVDSTMKSWKVPGLAMAIVKDGEVILSEGFGWRNVEAKLPVTPNTLLAIGSCSKAFTAACLGILVDDGKVEWDKPVRDFLPTFKLHDDFASARMTPRDLVTHRSGLPRHDLLWYGSSFTRKEMFERLQYLEPSKDFRTNYQYQNLMFMTAGYLVEQVAGSTWEDFVRSRIFTPLGMTQSNFSVAESQKAADFAMPYREEKEQIKLMPFRDISAVGPAGSINSNVAEMSNWVKLNLNKGKVGETQVISESMLAQMHTPYMAISEPIRFLETSHASYGLGWVIAQYRGHKRVAHGGNIDGFSALVSLLPQDNLGMVVLTNRNGNPLPNIVSLYATDLLLQMPTVDWNARVKAEVTKAQEADKQKSTDESAARKLNTKPSHALAEYAGEYEHPGYGVVAIKFDGKNLKARFNSFAMSLEHWHYDVFRAAVEEDPEQKFMMTFYTNDKGDVDRLEVPLEPAVKAIVFTRKPAAEMSDPKFLAQFVGEYDLAGQTVKVAIKGTNVLTVTVPGQPTYELEPYKETEFKLKALTGFSLKFSTTKDKGVTAATFIQPNGNFTATKK
jgi:CubicO group peptidase (beta-lactamase class C family)